jgi:hypothetical protein
VLASLGVYGLPRTLTWSKSAYGHTIETISAHARPGDGVLFYGPWQGIQYYYYQRDDFPPYAYVPRVAPPQLVPAEAEPVLHALLAEHQRLWVIPAAVDDVDPTHFVDRWLEAHAHLVWRTDRWRLYVPPTEQEVSGEPGGLSVGEGLRLERVGAGRQVVPAGEALRLTLTWAATARRDSGLVLSMSLVDQAGNRWQHWEHTPVRWSHPSSTWDAGDVIVDRTGLIVPQGAPPGRYTVRMTAVEAGSGTTLGHAGIELLTLQIAEPVSLPVLKGSSDFAGPFVFLAPDGGSDRLTLVGYNLGGLHFQQGHPIPLRLDWMAPADPTSDLEIRLELKHRPRLLSFGNYRRPVISRTLALAPGYPFATWLPGRLVSLPTALNLPNDAIPGRSELTLTVVGVDGKVWTINHQPHLKLATLTIEERPMLKELPPDLAPVDLDFVDSTGATGDRIGLRGYRIEGTAEPGGHLELHYAWLAMSDPERIYAVFNHLLTAEGQKLTQADGWPQGGVVLTNQWRAGEYIRDSHSLDIPADAPEGPYLLAVGLYDAASSERLNAVQSGQPLVNDQWLQPVGTGSE